ncbi:serine hydrolase [Dyadobacter alkalitolerans]|uniref:serine hydrolase n=1 Tax=Dyadobacter alkalitolerans TaxID=492736 RepID=UPI00040374E9|nr:serine hydrolase [Dyadobacter alkalitolerans]
MKNHLLKTVSCGLMLGAVLFSTSCKDQEILSENEKFELDGSDESAKLGVPTKFDEVAFANRIETYLEDKVAGFGYSIIKDGKEFYVNNGGDGYARKKIESNFEFHGANARQEIVATTQYVTAVAVMRVLEKYNLTLGHTVHNYLPKGWVPSASFKALTFERLLAHRTGLIDYANLNDLEKTVEGPINTTIFNEKAYQYSDANYELLALILPYVHAKELAKQGDSGLLNTLNSQPTNSSVYYVATSIYGNFVRTYVFGAAGLEHADKIEWRAWSPTGPLSAEKATKGYPSRSGSEPGLLKEDNLINGGATGLYISASQFAKLQYAVKTFKVIKMESVSAMKNKLVGFDGKLNGSKGAYYWKRGNGKNCETMVIDFGSVQVAVFANSPESEISDPVVLAKMFESSLHP